MASKALPRLSFLAIALGALVTNGHLQAYAGTDVQVASGSTSDVLRHVAPTQIVNQAKSNSQGDLKVSTKGDKDQNAVQQARTAEPVVTAARPEGLVGPMGPTGPTGATGATGSDGAQGLAGPAGPMGPMGPMGPLGVQGFQGAPGATGAKGADGAVGPAGPQGSQGPQGPQGSTGAAGTNGSNGAVGPAGPQGLQGATGADGAMGPVGPQGLKGSTGATGANGAVGPQGPQGPQGETGAAGTNGVNGVDGAVGPQGPQGEKGDKGDKGDTGDTGATGAKGADGVDGAVGPAGPSGSQGPAGPTGAQGPQGVFVQAEQTLATGTGWFTHYTDPTWVLESASNGGSLKLNRTAPTSDPTENKYLVFGMVYPTSCLGQTNAAAGASSSLKHGFRVATNPGDALSGTMCLEGSFATISVQDQDKRTELRCTRVSPTSIVCQKVN